MTGNRLFAALLICLSFILIVPAKGQHFKFIPKHFSEKKSVSDIWHHGFPDTIKVEHDMWSALVLGTTAFKLKSVHDVIKFYVNHDTNAVAQNYRYKVAFQVLGWSDPEDTGHYSVDYDTLTISYRPDSLQSYQDIAFQKYTGFHKYWVIVTDIYDVTDPGNILPFTTTYTSLTPSTSVPSPPGLNCGIEAEIYTQRYDNVYYGGGYPSSYVTSSLISTGSSNVTLKINFWNPMVALVTPAMYELEWTYVDNYKYEFNPPSVGTLEPEELTYNFNKNATRIITDKPYFRIPLVYEQGYVVFRVRLVRPDATKYTDPVYTGWSITSPTGAMSSLIEGRNYKEINGHTADNLNWQYIVSYGEEGKYKQQVSYMDGVLKERQSVTMLNSRQTDSTSEQITTNNIYDYEGRPVIKVMPMPIKGSVSDLPDIFGLKYLSGVAENGNTGNEYRPGELDTLHPYCPDEYTPPPLSTQFYKYYSALNSDTADFQKYLPRTAHYPFVHTVFAPGYSNRILKQSGVGDSLQIGGGRYTKYEYMMPEQFELNRLFGTEIGYSGYYKKTAVHDPNKQTSISIANSSGQTIMTSMVGLGPDSTRHPIDPMILPGIDSVVEDILYGVSNQTYFPSHDWIANKSFLAELSGTHNLQYILTTKPFQLCPTQYLRVPATYKYTMWDECGNEITDNSGTLGSVDMVSSSTAQTYTSSVASNYLAKGKYNVKKSLHIDPYHMDLAIDQYFRSANCFLTENYFIKKAVEAKSFPCKLDSLGYGIDSNDCDKIKKRMMKELYPRRKYGRFVEYPYTGAYYTDTINSIFTLLGPEVHRYQACPTLPTSVTYMGNVYTDLVNLPVDTFIKIFNDTIAEALLPLHPEYCKLKDCFDDNYEEFLRSLVTYERAEELNYFSLDQLVIKDSLYLKGIVPDFDSLRYFSGHTMPIDSLAKILAFCGGTTQHAMEVCMTNIFTAQVSAPISSATPVIKQTYFETLINLYIANRRIREYKRYDIPDTCGPCASYRMDVMGIPNYPPAILDSVTLTQLFSNSANGISVPSWVISVLTNQGPTGYGQPQATTQINSYYTQVCDSQVSVLMTSLANCLSTGGSTLSSGTWATIRAAIKSHYCTGNGPAVFEPSEIRNILVSNGVGLTDLCNPYVIDYPKPLKSSYSSGVFTCKSATVYDEVKQLLNDENVRGAINDVGTPYTILLNTGSAIENDMATLLGNTTVDVTATYSGTNKTYYVVFSEVSSPEIVEFWFQKEDLASPCDAALSTLYDWYFNDIKCLITSSSNANNTLINQFSFIGEIAAITGGGSTTTMCKVLGWNKVFPMLDTSSTAEYYQCTACPELKREYKAIKDTLATYGANFGNHLNYGRMVRSLANLKFGREIASEDYLEFIKSCAIEDSLDIRMITAEGKFFNINDAAVTSLLNSLNALGVIPNVFIDKSSGTDTVADSMYVFLTDAQYGNLSQAKKLILNNGGHYCNTLTPNVLAVVYLPDTFLSGFSEAHFKASALDVTVQSPQTIYAQYAPGSFYLPMRKYVILHDPGLSFAKKLRYSYSLDSFLTDYNIGSQLFLAYAPFHNEDYFDGQKLDFIDHNYNYITSTVHHEIIKQLMVPTLKAQLGSYTAYNVKYGNPDVANDHSHLYISTYNQIGHPGFEMAKDMIEDAEAANVAGSPFFWQSSLNVGTDEKAFRCGDARTYWYRKFETSTKKLRNIFIQVPKYIKPWEWSFDGLEAAEGNGDIYRFTVKLQKISNNSIKREAYGYADFPVGDGAKEFQYCLLCDELVNEALSIDTVTCESQILYAAVEEGKLNYRRYIDSIRITLKDSIKKFYTYPGNVSEQLLLSYRDQKYQFTLYYYDRAGNLMRTVPPGGTSPFGVNTAMNNLINERRQIWEPDTTGLDTIPPHKKVSYYQYDSRNMLIFSSTPDGGETRYLMNNFGQPMLSQNEEQLSRGENIFTYYMYDYHRRIRETGEADFSQCDGYSFDDVMNSTIENEYHHSDLLLNHVNPCITKRDILYFDYNTFNDLHEQDDRLRAMLYIRHVPAGFDDPSGVRVAGDDAVLTGFVYDAVGNVKTVAQTFGDVHSNSDHLLTLTTDYAYDQVNGKVNMVSYNRSKIDQYYHRYSYDEDNRITKVETSNDGIIWDEDANYQYYQHGPLARAELGARKVQGLDYAYTLQGWIKALNGDILDPTLDMGKDGIGNSPFMKDVFSYSLDYFNGDYTPVGTRQLEHIPDPTKGLYNGNIMRQTTSLHPYDTMLTKEYRYDPLNRLTKASYYSINTNGGDPILDPISEYRSTYKYDFDGNITYLTRYGNRTGGMVKLMDSMRYMYAANNVNNRLYDVLDYANDQYGGIDIGEYTDEDGARFVYDAKGNLVTDYMNALPEITWNLYNKVKKVTKGNDQKLGFLYNANGDRVRKTFVHYPDSLYGEGGNISDSAIHIMETYARDATGNIMAVYRNEELYRDVNSLDSGIAVFISELDWGMGDWLDAFAGNWLFMAAALDSFSAKAPVEAENLVKSSTANEYLAANDVLTSHVLRNYAHHSGGTNGKFKDLCQAAAPVIAYRMAQEDDISWFYKIMMRNKTKLNTTLDLINSETPTVLSAVKQALNISEGATLTTAKAYADTLWLRDSVIVRQKISKVLRSADKEQKRSLLAAAVANNSFWNDAASPKTNNIWQKRITGLLLNTIHAKDSAHVNDSTAIVQHIVNDAGALNVLRAVVGDKALLHAQFGFNRSAVVSAFDNAMDNMDLARIFASMSDMSVMKLATDVQLKMNDSLNMPPGDGQSFAFSEEIEDALERALVMYRMYLSEHHLYGSSRLGIKQYLPDDKYTEWNAYNHSWSVFASLSQVRGFATWYDAEIGDLKRYSAPLMNEFDVKEDSTWQGTHWIGHKQYELTDHLGNVQATVLDRLTPRTIPYSEVYTSYTADVATATDYYPFGMHMPGRSLTGMGPTAITPPDPYLFWTDSLEALGISERWIRSSGLSGAVNVPLPSGGYGVGHNFPVIGGQTYRMDLDITRYGSVSVTATLTELDSMALNLSSVLRQITINTGLHKIYFTPRHSGFVQLDITNAFSSSGSVDINSMNVYLVGGGTIPASLAMVARDEFFSPSTDGWDQVGSPSLFDNDADRLVLTSSGLGDGITKNFGLTPGKHYLFRYWLEREMGDVEVMIREWNPAISDYEQLMVGTEQVHLAYNALTFKPRYGGNVNITITDNTGSGGTFWIDAATIEMLDNTQYNSGNVPTYYVSGYRLSNLNLDKYRFGFNGQQKDNEIAGVGNHTTAKFWEYDTRVARRWNLDPIIKVGESPYATLGNNPIWFTDILGNDTSFSNASARRDFLSADKTIDDKSERYRKKIEKAMNKGDIKRVKKLEGEAKPWFEMRASFDNIINSKTMFHYIAKPNTGQISGGGTSYNFDNDRMEISYYEGNTHTVVHESVHGDQFLNKQWTMATLRDATDRFRIAHDYFDEFKAFYLESIFDPTSFHKFSQGKSIDQLIRINYPDLINERLIKEKININVTDRDINFWKMLNYKVAEPK